MIGTMLGNRYKIIEEIGNGGMAIVYKAHDRLLNRYVAVKILRKEYINDEDFVNRFNIEAQAAASLNHPNIVSIYDVGKQNDCYYIVMEAVEGVTLKEYIESHRPLKWRTALKFSMEICSALEHAHSKHIIHRDIKPQNIIVTKQGEIRVTDFGIARASTSATTNLGSSAMGSAHYLSPEQARGGFTDERSDIYSLGVCMYEMFTGELPFDGDNPVSVAMQHLQKTPPLPRSVNPQIPDAVEAIICKAMSKEQRMRYTSAKEMKEDLMKVAQNPHVDVNEIADSKDDIFSTKKISIPEDDLESEKKEIRRSLRTEDSTFEDQFSEKRSKTPAILAISVSAVIIAVLAFLSYQFLWGSSAKPKNTVPDLYNLTVDEAKTKVAGTEFTILEAQKVTNDTVEKDRIFKQEPAAHSTVSKAGEIMVYVSAGKKTQELPDYSLWSLEDAIKDINSRNLTYTKKEEENKEVPIGYIIRSVPGAKAQLKEGEAVTLYVSKGVTETMPVVPNLVGLTQEDAEKRLTENGLTVGKVTKQKSTKSDGVVLEQGIQKDTKVEKNTAVNLVVSEKQVEPSTAPVTKKFSFYMASDLTEPVTVTITSDTGEVVYSKLHGANEYVTVSLTGTGVHKYEINYKNKVQSTFTINFNE